MLAASLALSAARAAAPEPPEVAPAQPRIPAQTFLVSVFGTVADGRTNNTAAFRRAVAAVGRAGGGTLVVPAGVYLTDAFALCSGLNLRVEAGATLQFSPHGTLEPDGVTYQPLLQATDAHDIEISGSGTIHGSGEAWWAEARYNRSHHRPEPARPHSLVGFEHCQRVRVEGVTLTHAPEFNLVPARCEDVTIEGVTITNPADDIIAEDGVDPARVRARLQKIWDAESPNTDGIDPSVSQRVLISHCRIDTGDDCIAIKADDGGVTRDILVTDCVFRHGHGCSVGSVTRGGLRNLTVRRCTFQGTNVGINLKSGRGRGGLVENLWFEDLTMDHVGEAFVLTSYYPLVGPPIYYRPFGNQAALALATGGRDAAHPITATTPQWRNITLRRIHATCLWEAGLVLGLPEMPAEGITLAEVSIAAPDGLRLNYARDVTLEAVHITTLHGPAVLASDTVENLRP